MKNIFIWTFCLFISNVSGQELILISFSGTTIIDTVRFGFRQDATVGIDFGIGESNIINTPISSKELRVLQRDSLNFNCAYQYFINNNGVPVNNPFFIQPVFDSKVNFRNFPVEDENKFFEVGVYGDFSNGGLILFSTNSKPINEIIDTIYSEFGGCQVEPYPTTLPNGFPLSQINISTFAPQTNRHLVNLLFSFRKDLVSSNSWPTVQAQTLKLLPNPASNFVNIEYGEEQRQYPVQIVNLSGLVLLKGISNTQVNVSGLPNGIYLVKMQTPNGILFNKLVVNR